MKKIPTLAGIAGIAIVVGSFQVSATTSHNVTFSANVQSTCSSTGTPTISGTGFSSPTLLTSAFSPTINNAVAAATNGTIRFPTVSCNGSTIKVKLNPNGTAIISSGTAGTNQVNRIDYIADAILIGTVDTSIISVNTTGQSVPAQQFANSGQASAAIDLKISILPTPTGKTLVAGNYSGTLTISFDPN